MPQLSNNPKHLGGPGGTPKNIDRSTEPRGERCLKPSTRMSQLRLHKAPAGFAPRFTFLPVSQHTLLTP